jgi:hypothetical protein
MPDSTIDPPRPVTWRPADVQVVKAPMLWEPARRDVAELEHGALRASFGEGLGEQLPAR